MRANPLVRSVVAVAGIGCGTISAHATDWLQFGFDPAHSGNNPSETILSASGTGEFALTALFPIYNVTLPDVADGAPAFLSSVTTANGVRDLLFLETKDGHVLALDAATGATVWSHATKPTPPPAGQDYTTSSPAIDPNRQYVYFYGLDGNAHKYAVGTGLETSSGGWPERATLKPDVEKGSSALAIAIAKSGTTYLYVANGGYPGDGGDYQGHVTAIDLATGAQNVFNANCSDQSVHFVEFPATPDCSEVQTAIWARPGVIYSAAKDRIFMATGNGTYDPVNHDWGDSVFALNPNGTGSGGNPVDSYTPTNFQSLQNGDTDLGSTAPAILPSTLAGYPNLAVQGGKDAMLRLLNLDNLSGNTPPGPGHTGGELQSINVPQGGEVFAQPAVWVDSSGTTWVFVATGNGVSGLTLGLNNTTHKPALTKVWQNSTGGSTPVVANDVLYYFSGSINALNPKTGALLWSDSSPGGVHWESPIVVNGRVYITDQNGRLWAYALDGIFKNGFE
ncbi:MAG: PQQ-binding-like beta-propeller repeat protein [Xanthomonadaceae bacterium]|nr:PQQ-binding-like beta-propeller repeat protein [Xanthomonadaceae bacterium]